MTVAWFVVAVVGGALLSVLLGLGIGLAARDRVQRGTYAGTGLAEWTEQARRLPWADRWHLARANDRGRRARPELAATAARRGRVVLAVVGRQSSLPVLRWSLRLAVAVTAVQLGLDVRVLTRDDPSWISWVTLPVWLVALALLAVVPVQRRRQRSNLRRSVELDDALAADSPVAPTHPA